MPGVPEPCTAITPGRSSGATPGTGSSATLAGWTPSFSTSTRPNTPFAQLEDLLDRAEVLRDPPDALREGAPAQVVIDGDVRAAEAVDRLLRVAHHEQVARLGRSVRQSSAPPLLEMRMISSAWIGSVSWNSSTRIREKRRWK